MSDLGRVDGRRWSLAPDDELYPDRLRDMEHPPELIRGIGDPSLLSTLCLGVIGARRATPYGLAVARKAGRIAAESGITLVSGGAMGCDAAAARGALEAGGKTIVVSGVGANRVYPRSSSDVFRRAATAGGAVISLEPWDQDVRRYAFLRRNVVIAALATALVVSEAGQRSGTTSTATAAFEMGREVYAIPGSIFSPESQGSNALIRDGAAIVTCEEDLELLISRDFGVLRMVAQHPATPRDRILSALVASPMRTDDLANSLGVDPLTVLQQIADFEVRGVIMRLPDGRYCPTQETLLARDRIEGQEERHDV